MSLSTNQYAVSIIVPNYNHKRYLKKRLDSIYEQTVIKNGIIDYEVILLDDCSTDGSIDILSEYSAKNSTTTKFYQNEQNSGSPFKQWQKGCRLAKYDIVWIAESDDYAKPNFLEKLLPYIAKEECTLAFCSSEFLYTYQNEDAEESENIADSLLYYNILANTNQFNLDFTISSKEFVKNYLSIYNTIPNVSAAVIKRSKILEYIDDVTNFKVDGDYLLFIKMLLTNKNEQNTISYIAEPLNYYRKHANNTTNSKKNQAVSIKEHGKVYDYLNLQINVSYKVKIYQLFFQYINTLSWLELDEASIDDLFAQHRQLNTEILTYDNETFSVKSILEKLTGNKNFKKFLSDILGVNLDSLEKQELKELYKIELKIEKTNNSFTEIILNTINDINMNDNTNIFTDTIYCSCCESIVTKTKITTTKDDKLLCPECSSTPAQRLTTFLPFLLNINWRYIKLSSNVDNEYTKFIKLNCLRFTTT